VKQQSDKPESLHNRVGNQFMNSLYFSGEIPDPLNSPLQGIGIGIAVFDPCAQRPAEGVFLKVMQRNVDNLKRIIAGRHSRTNPGKYDQL
jgi:hypothetical protein